MSEVFGYSDIKNYFSSNREWIDEFLTWRINYIRDKRLNASDEGLIMLYDAQEQSTMSAKLEHLCAWMNGSEKNKIIVTGFLRSKLMNSGEAKTSSYVAASAPSQQIQPGVQVFQPAQTSPLTQQFQQQARQLQQIIMENSITITQLRGQIANLQDLLSKSEGSCAEYSKLYKAAKKDYDDLRNKNSDQEYRMRSQTERAEAAERRVKQLEEIVARQSEPAVASAGSAPSSALLINWAAIRSHFSSSPVHIRECCYSIEDAVDASRHGLTLEDKPFFTHSDRVVEQMNSLIEWGRQAPIRGQFIKNWIEKRSGKVLV